MSLSLEDSDSGSDTPDSSDTPEGPVFWRSISENPPAITEVVEELREAPVKKFGSFRVVNKRVKKVSLRTPLRPDHSYNAVSFNISVKKGAGKWVFVSGFEASGYLQLITIFKLVGRDVNDYIHKKNYWEQIHQKWYPRSWRSVTQLRLDEPVRIGPGETCGFYIHSNCEDDLGLKYRSCAPGVVLEDECIQVLHGWAHTSCIPFDENRGWIRQHRVLSGSIFYEPTPLRWSPDRNFFWSDKSTFQIALDAAMSTRYFSPGILVELMTFCGMDWFDPVIEPLLEDTSVTWVEIPGNNKKVAPLLEDTSVTWVEIPGSNKKVAPGRPSLTSLKQRISGTFSGFFRSESSEPPQALPSDEPPVPRQTDGDEKSPTLEDQTDDDESDGVAPCKPRGRKRKRSGVPTARKRRRGKLGRPKKEKEPTGSISGTPSIFTFEEC